MTLMLISTSYPGLLRLLISESNKRRIPGYEVVLIFETSQASFLISCFSLKISCEIKKISWQHAAMLADFLMPCLHVHVYECTRLETHIIFSLDIK
jgi:hypothetical protein